MVKFIGEYTGKVDDKGRLIFPAAFKAILPADGPMELVVKKDIYADCLEVWTYTEWERQSEALMAKLNFFNENHARFWRMYTRNRAKVQPDEKLGRISIPKQLLDSIGVTKEVVFSGCDHKIEIWAKEKYESSEISNEEYISLAGMLSDLR